MRTIYPNAEEKFISTGMRLEMKGRKEGMKKGIEKGIKKIAFSMIKEGYKDNEIIKLTGLNKKQITCLRQLKEFKLDENFE